MATKVMHLSVTNQSLFSTTTTTKNVQLDHSPCRNSTGAASVGSVATAKAYGFSAMQPIRITELNHHVIRPGNQIRRAEAATVLITHSKPLWNEKNLFTGCIDVSLTTKGVEEAVEVGNRISNTYWDDIYICTDSCTNDSYACHESTSAQEDFPQSRDDDLQTKGLIELLEIRNIVWEAATVLITHGEPLWNEKNLFTGCIDVSLTTKGVEEAVEVGNRISNTYWDDIYICTDSCTNDSYACHQSTSAQEGIHTYLFLDAFFSYSFVLF
nr:2,3-bisphosphoglycerate-dependent phosphoglycerate mutase [Tanacetum cinerariifolium]